MKTGLFFGSFNPVHIGHLIIASFIADNSDLNEIWFVVSPQNPFKDTSSLLNERHRYSLVQLAVENDKRFRASDVEFRLPKPSYTTDTLAYLAEKYPLRTFSLILGSDSFQNLPKWKNYNYIINNYNLFVYRRPGFEVNPTLSPRMILKDAPLLEISATLIRENIRGKKSIKYLVPPEVETEIVNMHYYGSASENPSQKNA